MAIKEEGKSAIFHQIYSKNFANVKTIDTFARTKKEGHNLLYRL